MIGEIRILEGPSFLLSDANGDIDPMPTSPNGMFTLDTRFLSRWVLTVNGERMRMLSVRHVEYFNARIVLVPPSRAYNIDPNFSVIRDRAINGVLEECLTVHNHGDDPIDVTLRLDADSDFADLFETKGIVPRKVNTIRQVDERSLILRYERENFRRQTTITSSQAAEIDEQGFTFNFRLAPNEPWSTTLTVTPVVLTVDGNDIRPDLVGADQTKEERERSLATFVEEAPIVNCSYQPLAETYQRSLVDLAALRWQSKALSGDTIETIYTAGLPWYMTLMGHDAILTSLQTLPFIPSMAAATLRVLGVLQGTRYDDFREEDPGRIPHEFRQGEAAAFEEQPHSPYFGLATTPLYVVLMDEYERWTGDRDLVRAYEAEARAAIEWLDNSGDLMGDGYVWYEPRNTQTGLANQGWKTSPEAICYRDGRLPGYPRAVCELQGYAYDAKRRAARLARLVWRDPAYADRLEREAAELRERFNRDFWIADGEYYALGLEADGSQIDALASNMGHLLWSGILPLDRARKVARHLVGPKLFSGWGVRCLARGQARYNPLGYHVGTVWPFDNSFIVWGLNRYSLDREAAIIGLAMCEAANQFDGRLPEAFAGFDRAETEYPIEYPNACSPYSLSAGTPMLLIRALLGMEPFGDQLALRPTLPHGLGRLEVLGVRGRWGRRDVFARGLVPVG